MFQKIGKYTLAFFITLALFFAYGILTLGNPVSTGESLHYIAGKTVAFSLGGSKTVGSVYVNIGSVYTEIGDTAVVEIEYSTASTANVSGGTDLGGKYPIANIHGEEFIHGANYNWTPVVTGVKKSARYLYFKANKNLELCEFVCLDTDGNRIPVTAQYQKENGYAQAELDKAVDAQKSFKISSAVYDTFTQEEGYYMTAVNTFLDGKRVYVGEVYNTDANFNALATIFMALPVAIFGNSVFALRLAPFLATCILTAFLYFLGKDLFKSERYAYLFSLLFMLGGLATTVGRMGNPVSLVASAIVASLYFTYRFFSRGVSEKRPLKGSMTVLVSGLFAALAMAMDTLAVLPVLGILVLFGFGVKRVRAAKALALEKAAGETEEAAALQKKISARYSYIQRASVALAVLSFAVGTFLIVLLQTVAYYPVLIKVYDNASDPVLGFGALLTQGMKNCFTFTAVDGYAAVNATNLFAWLLPLKASTVYSAHTQTEYLAWNVQMNPAAQVLALVAFVFSAVKVVKDIVYKAQTKEAKRFRRIFIVLVSAMAACMLAAGIKGGVTMLSAYAFSAFYLGCIPLALTAFDGAGGEACNKRLGAALTVGAVALIAVFFLLTVPSAYAVALPKSVAKGLFGWTSIVSNGYFRI